MRNIYLKDPGRLFLPVYVPGESYSFYINFENPINDPGFANFRLWVYKEDQALVNIGALKQHFVDGVYYNIYSDFVMPFVENGQYQFVIVNSVGGAIKARSNYILVESELYNNTTHYITFTSELNLDGYLYETLPSFVNKFRLPLSKIDYQFESQKKQYRNITNKKLRTITSIRDKKVKIEAYYLDEEGHEAMASVVDHDTITIDGVRYIAKTDYNVVQSLQANLVKGEFEAYEAEGSITQKAPTVVLELNQPSILLIGAPVPLTGTAILSSGVGTQYDFYKLGAQEPGQPQISNVHDYGNYSTIAGSQAFKVVASYTIGGAAGIASAEASVEGAFPIIATTESIVNGTPQPLISMSRANNIEILLAGETGGEKQFFEIPKVWTAERALVSVQYYVNRLARFEAVNKLEDFLASDVNVMVAGNSVPYTHFEYNGINRGAILIKLIFE